MNFGGKHRHHIRAVEVIGDIAKSFGLALAAKIAAGRNRKRIGLCPVGARPVRGGVNLVNEADEVIGQVTSGGFGPSFNGPVALGLINMDAADAPIFADLRGKKIAMEIHPLPFIPHNYKR